MSVAGLACGWPPPPSGGSGPGCMTAMPATKSRYSFPSVSQSCAPSPRTNTTGCRLYVPTMFFSDDAISSSLFILTNLEKGSRVKG